MEIAPPEYPPIMTQCKICDRQMSVVVDPNCEQVWIDKLLSMATCDRCYDFYRRDRDAQETIHQVCSQLCQFALEVRQGCDETRRNKIATRKAALKETLEQAVVKLLSNAAQKEGLTWTQPVSGVVNDLMDNPKNYFKIITICRTQIRTLVAAQ